MLSKESGVPVEIRLGRWSEMVELLKSGQIDFMSLVYSEDRARRFDFSEQTWTLRQAMLFLPGRQSYPHGLEQLFDESVAVEEHSLMHEELQKIPASQRIRIIPVANGGAALELLARSEVSAVAGNELSLRFGARRLGMNDLAAMHVMSPPYHIVTTKGRGESVRSLLLPLKKIRDSGRFGQLVEDHLVLPPQARTWRDYVRDFAALLAVMLLIVAGAILWNYFLRRQVKLRTLELAASERRTAAILETAADGIITFSGEGVIESVNTAAARIFGYSPEALTGRNISLLVPGLTREAMQNSTPSSPHDADGRREDGQTFPIDLAISVVGAGSRRTCTGIFRDLTERNRAEEQLRESEQRFRQMAESIPEVFWMSSAPATQILYLSPAFESIWGLPREEVLRDRNLFLNALHPEDRERISAQFREGMEKGTFEGEYRIVRPDGSIRWIQAQAYPILNASGQVYRYAGIAQDVTERKRSEQVLVDIAQGVAGGTGEVFFRSMVQSLARAFDAEYAFAGELAGESEQRIRTIAFSAHGAITENFEYDLSGTPCEHVVGKQLCIFPREVRKMFPQDRQLTEMDIESYVGMPLFDSAGRPLGLVAVMDNKPLANPKRAANMLPIFAVRASVEMERKRAEGALLSSEQRYRELFENANDILFTLDLEGRLTSLNKAGERITGYQREEALGMNIARILAPDSLGDALKMLEDEMAGRSRSGLPVEMIAKDGRRVALEIGIRKIVQDGRAVEFQGIARDITEPRRLEDQLRQAQKMEAVGRLAGGVAHDFNNLLMVIRGYSELQLETPDLSERMRLNALEIKKAADRAASLTSQLLAFSRKQVLLPKIINLNLCVEEMGKMLPRLIGEDIELTVDVDPSLHYVKADPGQIEQVILNLAVNARDAMPHGGKLVIETANKYLDEAFARHRPEVEPGPYVMLSVSDNGRGMDLETRKHIFEPFFTTKALGQGTGLGLATVYGIVKQSGGYIWVESEPGKGATFQIYLPRVNEIIEPAPEENVTVTRSGAETVLVVEDEEAVRQLACDFLRKNGYTVLSASDGTQAKEMAETHQGPIHLLVTDLVMPGMSGRELAGEISRLRPEIKVLYMSGYTDDAIVRRGEMDPDQVFLQKPFSLDSLARSVGELLEREPRSAITKRLRRWQPVAERGA